MTDKDGSKEGKDKTIFFNKELLQKYIVCPWQKSIKETLSKANMVDDNMPNEEFISC